VIFKQQFSLFKHRYQMESKAIKKNYEEPPLQLGKCHWIRCL